MFFVMNFKKNEYPNKYLNYAALQFLSLLPKVVGTTS